MEPGNQSALSAIRVGGNPRLWLQRHHYLGRLIGAGLRPLLLDSDVVLARNPYPYLHAPPFARFHALVLGLAAGTYLPPSVFLFSVYGVVEGSEVRRLDNHVSKTPSDRPRSVAFPFQTVPTCPKHL